MSRWFRFYDDALDDPKVQSLPGELFKAWVNLLCVASKNDGKLPLDDVAFMLRTDERKAQAAVTELTKRGLIDVTEDGPEPHNWTGRQHKSDVSNERVKRYRERNRNGACNVTQTVTVTPPDTETDTEQKEQKDRGASAPTENLAFVGRVVRLKAADLDRWRKAYHGVSDIVAELTKADDYYFEHPPKNGEWFFPVSKWLERAHREATARPDAELYRAVDYAPPTPEERERYRAMGLS